MVKKYRGQITMTFEALKQILNLPEDVNIRYIGQSNEDSIRECFRIVVDSNKPTDYTYETYEGARPLTINNMTLENMNAEK